MANFYVKNSGNDLLDGLSAANAWATIAKVWSYGAGTGYNPGDTIYFNRGDKWEEQLVFPSAGVLGSPITITAYGTGALPIITGRDDIVGWDAGGSWTQVGATNVWYMTLTHSSTRPRIWLNNVEVCSAPNAASVTAALPYYHDQATTRLYVYSPAPATPAATYTRIEKPNVRTTAIDINKKGYITISYLDIQGGRYGIRIIESSGMIIENCNIGKDTERIGCYVVYSGDAPYNHSENGILRNCTIDSGFRFYQDWVYGDPYFCLDGVNIRAAKNWKVYNNYVQDWNHCGMVLESYFANYTLDNIEVYNNFITCPSTNYGHGVDVDIDAAVGSGNTFHNNMIFDVGTQNQINGYGLEFYYNIIDTVRGAAGYAGQGSGIDLAGYEGDPSYQKIYNNVIANCEDYGIRFYDWVPSGYHDKTGIEVINNILYNNDADDGYQIKVYDHANISANIFKNNLFYKAGVTDLILYRDTPMTVLAFNAENGNAYTEVIENNITGDPLFVSSTDFSLQAVSPAINAGIDVSLDQDFIGTAVPYGLGIDIGAYEWFDVPTTFTSITLVSTPACYDPVDHSVISRWVATECPINFRLLRRDWYVISCANSGGYLAVNIYGTFTGSDGDVISVYDATTLSMYTGTITDSTTAPVLVTDILWVAGMDIKYINDHTLYAGYYFEGRLTINGVVEPLTIIASPDSFGYADLDVSAILRTKTRVGKVTNYLDPIMKDTYKSGNFTLEYRGCWWGSSEAYIPEELTTSPVAPVVWYYAECVRSIEQGCNLSEYVATDLAEAKWLNQFETPVYWYGLPFDISFIIPEIAGLASGDLLTVTTKVYDSENNQLGADIVENVDVDSLEGYVNNYAIDSTLIPVGASYFTVEITAP